MEISYSHAFNCDSITTVGGRGQRSVFARQLLRYALQGISFSPASSVNEMSLLFTCTTITQVTMKHHTTVATKLFLLTHWASRRYNAGGRQRRRAIPKIRSLTWRGKSFCFLCHCSPLATSRLKLDSKKCSFQPWTKRFSKCCEKNMNFLSISPLGFTNRTNSTVHKIWTIAEQSAQKASKNCSYLSTC